MYGTCTGLVGGPASYRPLLPSSPKASIDVAVAHQATSCHRQALPRTSSPDHGEDDAMIGVKNPCSYRPRTSASLCYWWGEEEDEEEDWLPAKIPPAKPRRTRFIESRAEEVLEDDEPPPRVRVSAGARVGLPLPAPASVVSTVAKVDKNETSSEVINMATLSEKKKKSKSVRWSEHLVSVLHVECSITLESVSTDDADAAETAPRLPWRRNSPSAGRTPNCPKVSTNAGSQTSQSLTDDSPPRPRLPRGAAEMLRGSVGNRSCSVSEARSCCCVSRYTPGWYRY